MMTQQIKLTDFMELIYNFLKKILKLLRQMIKKLLKKLY